SITHGPRMKTGRFPPIVTLPIFKVLRFKRANVTADYADITDISYLTRMFSASGQIGERNPRSGLRHLPTDKIDNGKRRVKQHEKCEREEMKFDQVKRPPIGQKAQQRRGLRFMQKESVVLAGQKINCEDDHKVNFSPEKRPQNPLRAGTEAVNQ